VGRIETVFPSKTCLPVLQLGSDSIVARDHVHLLGVMLSSDLSFDQHVSVVSASSFYWLRQLQRSRRSRDTESVATLVHSFIASHIDYCNAVLAGAPKATTNKLQRVLNVPVWSAVPTSSTEACRDSSILSYIGWMFLSESCTNSASWCSTVCTVKRLRTSWNCANQSQVSHHAATSSIRHTTAPGRTASPAQLLWPTGFLCGWSVSLEFPAGQLAESDY